MSSKNEQKPILASETQLTSSTFKHEAYDIYKELRAFYPVYPLSLGEQYQSQLITIKLKEENELGQCPIYFEDEKIADSLEEFLIKTDENPDYYMEQMDAIQFRKGYKITQIYILSILI